MTDPLRQLALLRRLLWPLSAAYGLIVRLRNACYDHVPAASRPAGLPVISIGNITVGGTGKTPIVIDTIHRLRALGRRPVILTRGYGMRPDQPSDEVLEFQQALPDVPVVVQADRLAGAAEARLQHAADCVVLDDGFQHRRLRRHLDVVVIDALDPWGGGRLLPAGRLREPLSSLGRAHLFLLSRANQADAPTRAAIESVLRRRAPRVPVLHALIVPAALTHHDGRTESAETLGYHNVLPVCGLGNPATFLRCVAELAGRVCRPLLFRDHQRYAYRHVGRIAAAARRRGADLVVTTRKDWVKLAPLWPPAGVPEPPGLARLDVRVELRDEQGVFDELLRRALEQPGEPGELPSPT